MTPEIMDAYFNWLGFGGTAREDRESAEKRRARVLRDALIVALVATGKTEINALASTAESIVEAVQKWDFGRPEREAAKILARRQQEEAERQKEIEDERAKVLAMSDEALARLNDNELLVLRTKLHVGFSADASVNAFDHKLWGLVTMYREKRNVQKALNGLRGNFDAPYKTTIHELERFIQWINAAVRYVTEHPDVFKDEKGYDGRTGVETILAQLSQNKDEVIEYIAQRRNRKTGRKPLAKDFTLEAQISEEAKKLSQG